MKNVYLINLIFFLMCLSLHATEQAPDIIKLNDKKYYLSAFKKNLPLESFFNKKNKRPYSGALSTGCWRGYKATWKIKNNKLILESIDATILDKDHNKRKATVKEYIGDLKYASWFTGELKLSIKSNYISDKLDKVIKIKNGKVIK
ncbi:MAG: hypothetical protein COA79_22750 [Planctomycetota bacterium]|nr:MAG: hypothetical protein COA79_22750 [Planctomycetota bacterium]